MPENDEGRFIPGRNGGRLKPAKKGEVRNPKGRTKGSLNWSTVFKKFLDRKIEVADPDEDGKPVIMTRRDAIALGLVIDATENADDVLRLKAAGMIFNLTEPKGNGATVNINPGGGEEEDGEEGARPAGKSNQINIVIVGDPGPPIENEDDLPDDY
jgi:hypothetical protein